MSHRRTLSQCSLPQAGKKILNLKYIWSMTHLVLHSAPTHVISWGQVTLSSSRWKVRVDHDCLCLSHYFIPTVTSLDVQRMQVTLAPWFWPALTIPAILTRESGSSSGYSDSSSPLKRSTDKEIQMCYFLSYNSVVKYLLHNQGWHKPSWWEWELKVVILASSLTINGHLQSTDLHIYLVTLVKTSVLRLRFTEIYGPS